MTDEQLDELELRWEKAYDGKDVCELIAEVRRLRKLRMDLHSSSYRWFRAGLQFTSDLCTIVLKIGQCQRNFFSHNPSGNPSSRAGRGAGGAGHGFRRRCNAFTSNDLSAAMHVQVGRCV